MASGRTIVRKAVTEWVAKWQITDLNQVFSSFPKRIDFEVNAFPGQNNRAAAVVFIEAETESRIAIGGVEPMDTGGAGHGWKRVDYSVALQIFHHSTEREAQDAMDNFDVLIDTIKAYLRAGQHTLGVDEDQIWQAAEPDINVQYGEPLTNKGGTTETWAAIRFTVTQMIET